MFVPSVSLTAFVLAGCCDCVGALVKPIASAAIAIAARASLRNTCVLGCMTPPPPVPLKQCKLVTSDSIDPSGEAGFDLRGIPWDELQWVIRAAAKYCVRF